MLQTKLYQRKYNYKGLVIPNAKDPFVLFKHWFREAHKKHSGEPNAMVLATVDSNGQPSARYMLLKEFSKDGFSFFTNINSRKAKALSAHKRSSILFYWHEIHRQVRIEGVIKKLSDHEADEYFSSRPRGSQLAAWTSQQSRQISSRLALLKRFERVSERFEGRTVTRPPHWGGYVLVPSRFEFWSGMPSRLHDRVLYKRKGVVWERVRLYP